MAGTITAGGSLGTAAPARMALPTNYVNFTSAAGANWGQQYLPDLMEQEVERYGKRTVAGFLAQVGAEEASQSDRVVWSEQGRLHLSYTGTVNGAGLFTVAAGHQIRVGATVVLSDNQSTTIPCYVSAVAATTATLLPYEAAAVTNVVGFQHLGLNAANTASLFVYGSEYAKGDSGHGLGAVAVTAGSYASIEPSINTYQNKMIIIKDTYRVSGSDVTQIGWIEVSGEDGQNGYYWYLKAEGDTMSRFADYCEMTLLEGKETAVASVVENAGPMGLAAVTATAAAAHPAAGTEGLFEWTRQYGNSSNGITGLGAADLADFDAIVGIFDSEGAIEENMIWCNRTVSLAIDDMMSQMTGGGLGGATSYGVFQNDENMALNLGFTGLRRGSYDFYKADWKYLNDGALRGGLGFNDVRGVFIPAGASNVYDEMLGRNMKRPYLHMRYRANDVENRKLKTWITDSVGAATSDLDVMTVNYLSERCLVVQGANNFMLLN